MGGEGVRPNYVFVAEQSEVGTEGEVEGDYVALRRRDLAAEQHCAEGCGEVTDARLPRARRVGLDLTRARTAVAAVGVAVVALFVGENDYAVPADSRAVSVGVPRKSVAPASATCWACFT